jgi:hypothetical protein
MPRQYNVPGRTASTGFKLAAFPGAGRARTATAPAYSAAATRWTGSACGTQRATSPGIRVRRPNVSHVRGILVQATKTGFRDALLDIDGEAPGKLDASFRILPGAIRMLERP